VALLSPSCIAAKMPMKNRGSAFVRNLAAVEAGQEPRLLLKQRGDRGRREVSGGVASPGRRSRPLEGEIDSGVGPGRGREQREHRAEDRAGQLGDQRERHRWNAARLEDARDPSHGPAVERPGGHQCGRVDALITQGVERRRGLADP
jgi:hypothetical protein